MCGQTRACDPLTNAWMSVGGVAVGDGKKKIVKKKPTRKNEEGKGGGRAEKPSFLPFKDNTTGGKGLQQGGRKASLRRQKMSTKAPIVSFMFVC